MTIIQYVNKKDKYQLKTNYQQAVSTANSFTSSDTRMNILHTSSKIYKYSTCSLVDSFTDMFQK